MVKEIKDLEFDELADIKKQMEKARAAIKGNTGDELQKYYTNLFNDLSKKLDIEGSNFTNIQKLVAIYSKNNNPKTTDDYDRAYDKIIEEIDEAMENKKKEKEEAKKKARKLMDLGRPLTYREKLQIWRFLSVLHPFVPFLPMPGMPVMQYDITNQMPVVGFV